MLFIIICKPCKIEVAHNYAVISKLDLMTLYYYCNLFIILIDKIQILYI